MSKRNIITQKAPSFNSKESEEVVKPKPKKSSFINPQELLKSYKQLPINENQELYKRFDYADAEWDNVPTIVPRYALHVENYLELMSTKNKKLETTANVRKFVEKRLEDNDEILSVARNKDWLEKENIIKSVDKTDNDL